MRISELGFNIDVTTRDALDQGVVYRYVTSKAKPGLRMTCETPEGKDGHYSVRLSDGVLMHSSAGSDSASKWPVQVVMGEFYETAYDPAFDDCWDDEF